MVDLSQSPMAVKPYRSPMNILYRPSVRAGEPPEKGPKGAVPGEAARARPERVPAQEPAQRKSPAPRTTPKKKRKAG